MITLKRHVKVGARFQMTSYKADGTVKEETPEFDNIWLNQGLDLMGTQQYIAGVAVGTGNSTPVITQTNLDARVATTTTAQTGLAVSYTSTPTPKYTITAKYRFNAGTLNNVNLSEVCIVKSGAPNEAVNRALIKDAGGTATTITVLNDEYLDVSIFVDFYPETTDFTQTINLNNGSGGLINTVNLTIRAAFLGSTTNPPIDTYFGYMYGAVSLAGNTESMTEIRDGAIGTTATSPAGTVLAKSDSAQNTIKVTQADYVAGSYKRSATLLVKLNGGNGNIRSLLQKTTLGCFQVEFNPVIAKNSSQTLSIPIELSWSRYVP